MIIFGKTVISSKTHLAQEDTIDQFLVTEDALREYAAFLAGLPLVNQIFFEHDLAQVKKWGDDGYPEGDWPEVKRALRDATAYLARVEDFAPIKDTTLTRLGLEAEKATPDIPTIRAALDEMWTFART